MNGEGLVYGTAAVTTVLIIVVRPVNLSLNSLSDWISTGVGIPLSSDVRCSRKLLQLTCHQFSFGKSGF